MLIDYTQVKKIFIFCGKTDLRRGIDGLATIVTEQFKRLTKKKIYMPS